MPLSKDIIKTVEYVTLVGLLAFFAKQPGITSTAVLKFLNEGVRTAHAQGTIPEPTEEPGGTIPEPTATPRLPQPPPEITPNPEDNLNCQVNIYGLKEDGNPGNGPVRIQQPDGSILNVAGIQSYPLHTGETQILVGPEAHNNPIENLSDVVTYTLEFLPPEQLPPGYQEGCNPEADPISIATEGFTGTVGFSEIDIALSEQQVGATAATMNSETAYNNRDISVVAAKNGEKGIVHTLNDGSIEIFSSQPIAATFKLSGDQVVTEIRGSSNVSAQITNSDETIAIEIPAGVVQNTSTLATSDVGNPVLNGVELNDTDTNGIIDSEEVAEQIKPKTTTVYIPLVANQ